MAKPKRPEEFRPFVPERGREDEVEYVLYEDDKKKPGHARPKKRPPGKVVKQIRPPREPKRPVHKAPTHTIVIAARPGGAAVTPEIKQRGAKARWHKVPAFVAPGVGGREAGQIRFENNQAFRAQNIGKPCGQKRRGCPVQLVFRRGQAQLRFCKRAGNKQYGYVVNVNSPQEAREAAAKACAVWKRDGSFEKHFGPSQTLGRAGKKK